MTQDDLQRWASASGTWINGQPCQGHEHHHEDHRWMPECRDHWGWWQDTYSLRVHQAACQQREGAGARKLGCLGMLRLPCNECDNVVTCRHYLCMVSCHSSRFWDSPNLQVQTLVKEKLTAEGLTVKSEGQIKSQVIDTGLILANEMRMMWSCENNIRKGHTSALT